MSKETSVRKLAFARAAAKTPDAGTQDILDVILSERPDLKGQPVYHPQYGATSHTLIFENEVFKAPRNEYYLKYFDQEYAVLKLLKEAGLPVAEITHIGQAAHFFGQKRIHGIPMGGVYFGRLFDEEKELIAKDIAKFMHDVAKAGTPEKMRDIGKKNLMPQQGFLQAAMEKESARIALGDKYEYICRAMTDYAATLPGRSPRLVHGDLSGGNILFDEHNSKLAGIIDFGNALYTAPEYDFVCLFEYYQHSFVKMIAREYAALSGEKPITESDTCLYMIAGHFRKLEDKYQAAKSDPTKKTEFDLHAQSLHAWIDRLEDSGYRLPVQKAPLPTFKP